MSARRTKLLFLFCSLGLVASFYLNLVIGSLDIPLAKIMATVFNGMEGPEDTYGFIVWKIRLPRAVAATWGGACLAVAGLLLQVFFRNPIVGPFILGISSGATLMVGLVMLTTAAVGFTALGPFLTTGAAFVGAVAAMLAVTLIATRVSGGVTLLITGLMIGYLANAVTAILIAFADAEKIKGFKLWTLGSFAGYRWSEVGAVVIGGGALMLGAFLLAKQLNAFLMGEEYAATMGVNVRFFRVAVVFLACGLAALVTSTAGPVAFIGLAVPHIARLSLSGADNRLLIPITALIGGIVTGLCDLIARMLFSPVETPLSAVTAFFGAPIVIGLLIRRSKSF